MLKLHGFPVSNYYNIAKFALLEKGMDFEEVQAMPSQESDFKSKSPMGKIPALETAEGFITETDAIVEYLESVQPEPRLIPADPYAAARVREMMKMIELYIELPSRRHYAEVFFGGERNDTAVVEAKPIIENGLAAIRHCARFSPFICGEFSAADIYATHAFIYAAPVCEAVYDWDIVAEVPGLQDAIDATNARPAGQKVAADHGAAMQAFKEANS